MLRKTFGSLLISLLVFPQPTLFAQGVSPATDTVAIPPSTDRVRLVAGGHLAVYGGSIAGLSIMWYSKKPQSTFHFFDDNAEWLQIDKAGHLYGAYQLGRASHALWRWAGVPEKKSVWLGGLSGLAFQTIVEVLDGFQASYGFSIGDYVANLAGTATFVSQELAWEEQRIKIKFSSVPRTYAAPDLAERAKNIYGSTLPERLLKDYNHQAYWVSANLHSLLGTDGLPPWLNLAVGYGAEGMFGARSNVARDAEGNITFDRSDIPRARQWFLSPDIDFSKIKTSKKGIRVLLFVLDAVKFPAPALELSHGRLKGRLVVY